MKLTDKIEEVRKELPEATEIGQTFTVNIKNDGIEHDMDLGYTPEARMGDYQVEFEKTERGWELKNVVHSIL